MSEQDDEYALCRSHLASGTNAWGQDWEMLCGLSSGHGGAHRLVDSDRVVYWRDTGPVLTMCMICGKATAAADHATRCAACATQIDGWGVTHPTDEDLEIG